MQEIEDSQSINMTKINELENRIEKLEAEKSEISKNESKSDSTNTGYILGGLALLALIL